MSEYQYHEWQAVDRVLTSEEQVAVYDLSSHIEVSSSRAVVTYHWSNFRHDPKQVLLKYFDAYFYLANWGSLRLMFRFPKGLLDEADIETYCIDEFITFETIGRYQVLDLDFSPEDGMVGWKQRRSYHILSTCAKAGNSDDLPRVLKPRVSVVGFTQLLGPYTYPQSTMALFVFESAATGARPIAGHFWNSHWNWLSVGVLKFKRGISNDIDTRFTPDCADKGWEVECMSHTGRMIFTDYFLL